LDNRGRAGRKERFTDFQCMVWLFLVLYQV
jgi:hypothetical protein